MDIDMINRNCVGCGKSPSLENGRLTNQQAIDGEIIFWICAGCVLAGVSAWAREHRIRNNTPPPTSPTPTSPPSGDSDAPLLVVAA